MWAVRTKSGRCGATTSRTLKVRGTELAAVSVNITAYRWPHWCIKDDLITSQSMTHTLLFNSQRAYCVTLLLFPETSRSTYWASKSEIEHLNPIVTGGHSKSKKTPRVPETAHLYQYWCFLQHKKMLMLDPAYIGKNPCLENMTTSTHRFLRLGFI